MTSEFIVSQHFGGVATAEPVTGERIHLEHAHEVGLTAFGDVPAGECYVTAGGLAPGTTLHVCDELPRGERPSSLGEAAARMVTPTRWRMAVLEVIAGLERVSRCRVVRSAYAGPIPGGKPVLLEGG